MPEGYYWSENQVILIIFLWQKVKLTMIVQHERKQTLRNKFTEYTGFQVSHNLQSFLFRVYRLETMYCYMIQVHLDLNQASVLSSMIKHKLAKSKAICKSCLHMRTEHPDIPRSLPDSNLSQSRSFGPLARLVSHEKRIQTTEPVKTEIHCPKFPRFPTMC